MAAEGDAQRRAAAVKLAHLLQTASQASRRCGGPGAVCALGSWWRRSALFQEQKAATQGITEAARRHGHS